VGIGSDVIERNIRPWSRGPKAPPAAALRCLTLSNRFLPLAGSEGSPTPSLSIALTIITISGDCISDLSFRGESTTQIAVFRLTFV